MLFAGTVIFYSTGKQILNRGVYIDKSVKYTVSKYLLKH